MNEVLQSVPRSAGSKIEPVYKVLRESTRPELFVSDDASTNARYIRRRLLGSGAYGEAWLCSLKGAAATVNTDDDFVVVKEIITEDMSERQKAKTESEVKVHATVNHPNIVRFIEHKEEDGMLYIAMEWADGGDLRRQLKIHASRKQQLHESEAMFVFIQVALAIEHMHSQRMLHRDIKSANVLVTTTGMVKMADFGFSRQFDDEEFQAKTFCGTPYYLAPELWMKTGYNAKAEVWSLGVLLYELLTLRRPFASKSTAALMQEILRGKYTPPPTRYSESVRGLVMDLLTVDPNKRPTTLDIFRRPFVQQMVRMLISIVSENESISAKVRHDWCAQAAGTLTKVCASTELSSATERLLLGDSSLVENSDEDPSDGSDAENGRGNKGPRPVRERELRQAKNAAKKQPPAENHEVRKPKKPETETPASVSPRERALRGKEPAATMEPPPMQNQQMPSSQVTSRPQSPAKSERSGQQEGFIASEAGGATPFVTDDSSDDSVGSNGAKVLRRGHVNKLRTLSTQDWAPKHLTLTSVCLELRKREGDVLPRRSEPLGIVVRVDSVSPKLSVRDHVFSVHMADGRKTWLEAPNAYEKKQWIAAISSAVAQRVQK